MSEPAKLDLSGKRGDTFEHELLFVDAAGEPVDYSGSTWLAQLRGPGDDTGAPTATFAVDDQGPTVDGYKVVLTLPDDETADLVPGRPYRWDLEQTLDGTVTTLIGGRYSISADVSRAG